MVVLHPKQHKMRFSKRNDGGGVLVIGVHCKKHKTIHKHNIFIQPTHINAHNRKNPLTRLKEVYCKMDIDGIILAIIIGTLAAIVYSLRILVLLERRIANMDLNIERIVARVEKEELKIEAQEKVIVRALSGRKPKRR